MVSTNYRLDRTIVAVRVVWVVWVVWEVWEVWDGSIANFEKLLILKVKH